MGTAAAVSIATPLAEAPAPAPGPAPWSPPKREAGWTATSGREVVRLVWYDQETVPRIRRVPRWKPVLEELDRKPADYDLDDPALSKDPMEVEDRRDVFEILTHGERTDGRGIEDALESAIRQDGKFVPPLVLVAGELEMPFDELEVLKAAVSAAAPLVTPADENLRASISTAKEFLQTPDLASSPSVCEGLSTRIRDAFSREKKGFASDYLDMQMERALLAGRRYQRRDVLGGTHLRFLLRPAGESTPFVGYVHEEVAKKLPMFKRFRGRVIAEVHLPEDQYETASCALRVAALARIQAQGRGQ